MSRVLGVLAVLALAFGLSFATPTVSDQASENACFGQARAATVQSLTDAGFVVGRDFFSQRKGENAAMNAAYKAFCAP